MGEEEEVEEEEERMRRGRGGRRKRDVKKTDNSIAELSIAAIFLWRCCVSTTYVKWAKKKH